MAEDLKLENGLESKLDKKAARFGANRDALQVLLAALRAEEDQIRQGGGPKAAEAQKAKGRLTVRERLKLTGVAASELRFELVGVESLHGAEVSAHAAEPYEVRVRVAGRTESLREAVRIGNEVETLYTNGPAAGGGAWKSARDVVAVASVLLPRELATPQIRFVGA